MSLPADASSDWMDILNSKFEWIKNSLWFKWLLSAIILLNPIAIGLQVWKASTAPNVEGVSVAMYVIFALLQTAFLLQGIRLKDKDMFVAMVLSIIESLAIIFFVLLRT